MAAPFNPAPVTIHLTRKSRNAKVGPIPVSTTSEDTCPNACPFNTSNAGGCYANGGPLFMHWQKVSRGERGTDLDMFADKIAALPDGQMWRHNQAGDLPGDGERIDGSALRTLTMANAGKRGFTYTHYDVESRTETALRNKIDVQRANAAGFTVNLSGNSLEHADTLADLGAGPVVSVLPSTWGRGKSEDLAAYRDRIKGSTTPEGRAVTVCPATYLDTNCAACGLCQKSEGRAIVGFPAHGASVRRADRALSEDRAARLGHPNAKRAA